MFSFFFFKQKTAYEVRISAWSSDVFSSDLDLFGQNYTAGFALGEAEKVRSLLDAARAENSRQVGNVLIRWANGWLCQGLTVSPLRNAAGATAGFVVIAEASTPERVHHEIGRAHV